MKEKFYNKTWFFVLMCIFVQPIGIVMAWTIKKDAMKTPTKVILTFALSLVFFILLGSVLIKEATKTNIDMANYSSIKVDGYDGVGNVSEIEIDTIKLANDYSDLKDIKATDFNYEMVDNSIDGKIKNNDIVAVILTYKGYDFSNYNFDGEVKYTVSGLMTKEEYDKIEADKKAKLKKEEEAKKKAENTKIKKDLKDIKDLFDINFKGIAKVKTTSDSGMYNVTIIPTDESFKYELVLAMEGNPTYVQSWNEIVESTKDTSVSVSKIYPDNMVTINIANPANTKNVLLTVSNGVVIYNFID